MKLKEDGSCFDMTPLTVAMTQETFDSIRDTYLVSRALAEAVLAAVKLST